MRVWEVETDSLPVLAVPDADGLIVAGPLVEPGSDGCVPVLFHQIGMGPLVPAALRAGDREETGTVTVHARTCPADSTRLAFLVGRYVRGEREAAGLVMPVVTVGVALRPEESGPEVVPLSHRVRLHAGSGWVERTVWELVTANMFAVLRTVGRI